MNKNFYVFLVIIYFLYSYTVYADILPGSVEPGRISKQISNIKKPFPKTKTATISSAPQLMTLPSKVAAIKWVIKKIIITGNTVYSSEVLLKLFSHPMNTTITLGDIQQFVNEITLKYNQDGYVFSQAILPPQKIKNGVVHIQVIEGYVDKVSVKGNVSVKTQNVLLRYAQKATQQKPLQIKKLEREMLLINNMPGIIARAILTPSKTTPAAADLVLVVVKKITDLFASYDNRGTRYIGPTRLILSADVNDMLGDGAMTLVRSAGSGGFTQLRYFEIEHKQLIGTSGFFIDLDGQITRTEPGFLLADTDNIGRSKVLLLTMQYPLIKQREQSLSLNAGFSYINANVTELSTKFYSDQIRTFQAGATWDNSDQYEGSNYLSGVITKATTLFGASKTTNLVSRYLASPTFTKINIDAHRLQALPYNFSLYLAASGQYSFERLYSYEQFGYGGLSFGNAYDPSEILGDSGVDAKAELRFNTILFPKKNNFVPLQLFIYYDGGVLWNIDHINQQGRLTGTSAGFGLRFSFMNHLNFSLELDKPLDRKVAVLQALPGENPYAWREFFNVSLVD